MFSDDRDLLDIIILLDQVRHGFFTAVFISPPAATWSRLRNSQVPGQVPLRSRQFPLGITTLSPESRSKVRASNFSLEVSSWFAEQILRFPQLQTFFLLVFPEDFGGDSCTGPASPWSAREFTDLSDAVEAQRGAVYLCRFAGAEYRRSVGLLTNVQALSSDTYLGWPSFNTLDSMLQYVGPLPATCACSTIHPSLRGLATKGGFKSFFAQSLGPRFWARILNKIQDSQLPCSLREGAFSIPSRSAGIVSSGDYSDHGFALSAAPESVSALYEAWKSNTLTRSLPRNFSASRLDSFFESKGLARNTVFLFSLLSPACKFLESRRAARAVPGFSGMSSPLVPSIPLCSPVSPDIGHATHPGSSSIFSGFSPVLSGAAPLDGERSFEHFPPLVPAGTASIQFSQPDVCGRLSDKPASTTSIQISQPDVCGRLSDKPARRISIQFPQPDDCESPSDKQDCTTSIQFPQSDESERHSDFPARSRSKRKCPMEFDGRFWERYDTLDATGEPASLCGNWALEYILAVTSEYAFASGPW